MQLFARGRICIREGRNTMDKKYRTSVRRALNHLLVLDAKKEYTALFADEQLLDQQIDEVIQWLVDRDARYRAQIANFVKERIRNVSHIPD